MTQFSIVVPVYNSEQYLNRCIRSVLSQGYQNWELLLVDDGSSDGSGALLESFRETDPRIRVFHQENRGQYHARRTGIRHAGGEYLLFLDSDDELGENSLEILEDRLQKDRADIALFEYSVIVNGVDSGRVLGQIAPENRTSLERIRETVLFTDTLNSLCTKAFRRCLFDENDTGWGDFSGPSLGKDKAQLLSLLAAAGSAVYIPRSLYRYHHRADSISHCCAPERIGLMLAGDKFKAVKYYMGLWNFRGEYYDALFNAYFLRHLTSVYFSTRKSCRSLPQWIRFRRYPWKRISCRDAKRFCTFPGTSSREKQKLLAYMLRL